jgi:hypothetical protein
MRILCVDVDNLRPDRLGCYGDHRDTSPPIDALARDAVRFDACSVTDTSCLPSRTAAQPFVEGPTRGFRDRCGATGWLAALRQAGYHEVDDLSPGIGPLGV